MYTYQYIVSLQFIFMITFLGIFCVTVQDFYLVIVRLLFATFFAALRPSFNLEIGYNYINTD